MNYYHFDGFANDFLSILRSNTNNEVTSTTTTATNDDNNYNLYLTRVFHLRLRFITFGGSSTQLAYQVHKSGRKTSIIIIILYLIKRLYQQELFKGQVICLFKPIKRWEIIVYLWNQPSTGVFSEQVKKIQGE